MPTEATGATLAAVPDLLLAELDRARRGVVVLAVDGLSYPAAVAAGWDAVGVTSLRSTVPSTSATAWLTALTGVGPQRHGVPGMVYRVPARGNLVHAVTGRVLATGPADPDGEARLVLPQPTVFDRAGAAGTDCRALAREIGRLPGPWARALLHGATVIGDAPEAGFAAEAADPARLARVVARQVDGALAAARSGRPLLLWVYVNLDDHVHQHGYDDAAIGSMRYLADRAGGWCAAGWTVVAHADHGQVPCRPDPALGRAWSVIDSPANCYLPGGGAGRVRWLYPWPHRQAQVRDGLAAALGEVAKVVDAAEMPGYGPDPGDAVLSGRIGAVVAIAAASHFPVPDDGLGWEHGGTEPDEMLVPLAIWHP